MTKGLSQQVHLAPDFLAEQWPDIRDQAGRIAPSHTLNIRRVILCGCGDSHHAAIGLAMMFRAWSRLVAYGVSSLEGSRTLLPAYQPVAEETLVIGISSSGEVARTLEALEIAGNMGMPTMAMTSNAASSLAREARFVLSAPFPLLPKAPGKINDLGLC